MAINFSASFAACLAAGLKVPRQIMYCISQDTGAPYVLYKDSQDAVERGGLPGQWNADVYPSMQQQSPSQAHITTHNTPQITSASHQNQHTNSSQSPRNEETTNTNENHANGLSSPANSPSYPNANNNNQDEQVSCSRYFLWFMDHKKSIICIF